MPSSLVLCLFCLFVLWLIATAWKGRGRVSPSLWIAVIWISILGSKPVSLWLGLGRTAQGDDANLEGSPLDALVFVVLIVAALVVLCKRRIDWHSIIVNNGWIFAFFLYCGVSVLWADHSFVSFKRWFKDCGNVAVALLILTEKEPTKAIEAAFLIPLYLLIPLSVLFIRYYPHLGTKYGPWGTPIYGGVTDNKNMLGLILLVFGLFFIAHLLATRTRQFRSTNWTDILLRVLPLTAMFSFLFYKAKSSTSLVCLVFGASILLGMRYSAFRNQVRHLGIYTAIAVMSLFLLHSVINIGETLVQTVGRDMSFTGRTVIWELTLKEKINPLLGVGYYSFWNGQRCARVSEPFWFRVNEAHNGYLETYLNTGLIGVILLVIILLSAGARIRKAVVRGSEFAAMRLAFLAVGLIYNMTESAFNRMNLVWLILLIVIMECPRPARVKIAKGIDRLRDGIGMPQRVGFCKLSGT